MKPDTSSLKKPLQTAIFLFLSVFLVCWSAGTASAEHDHMQEPDSHNHADHYEGDGHDHGEGNSSHQLNNEGIALYRAKDYKAAAEKFKQAIALDPDVGEIHAMLGQTQEKLGDFELAIANLTTSLGLTKNQSINRLTHKYLARAYIGLRNFEEARKEIGIYKEMCVAQNALTPKTEQIIGDLYDQLK
ncbi:MAG: tetratricopeptide repeat protein [Desulfobulbaceae bacterium]|uniref:Tetratricopeptide repeat protein n=1 Tax=Candidatus Desulfobia pelagia TaxID=2841692 RepID=A0A8J6TFR7_9BACT|nr:tetratricopeptide repeat protein [Candidatus Desulfobia pelagia]